MPLTAPRVTIAVTLLALMLGASVENTIVRAYADWIECFDDPTTFDLTDIHGVAVKPVPQHDPMDEVRWSWLRMLRPSSRLVVVETSPGDSRRPEPTCPRAPPVAWSASTSAAHRP